MAPRIIELIRDVIVDINRQGTGVLLIEQNAQMALSIADHAYVLENGKVAKAARPRIAIRHAAARSSR